MPPRLALELVDHHGQARSFVLPDEVHRRPLRVGYRGDVEIPLPGEILVGVKRGRVYVASMRHEVPASLGGMRLPTWPVPVPIPCALAIGASELRLVPATARMALGVMRPSSSRPPPAAPSSRPPPYLADRVMLAIARFVARNARDLATEWRLARWSTKLAFATVLFMTVVVATRLAP